MYVYNYYFKGNQLYIASDFHNYQINRYFYIKNLHFIFSVKSINESWDSFKFTC